MPVNVRSIPALIDFRAALITFADSARRAMDEVRMEMQRGLMWIGDEQPKTWKSEQQRSWDLVAEKRHDLEACESRALQGQRPTCYQERKALEAAKRYTRFVEEQIDRVRRWGRTMVEETNQYEGQVARFWDWLENEHPKAVQLLERLVGTLEAYTSIPTSPALAAPLGVEPQSIARDTPEPEATPQVSLFAALREFTPRLDERHALESPAAEKIEEWITATRKGCRAAVSPSDAASAPADGDSLVASPTAEPPGDDIACQQAALKLAYDVHAQPAFPGWNDKVIIVAGCLIEPQVYAQRIEAADGDSGWFVGPVEPELGTPPVYEAVPLSSIVQVRPALVTACALPAGYLAVFSHNDLVALLDPENQDLWPVVEKLKS